MENVQQGRTKILKTFIQTLQKKEINSKTRNKGRDRGVKDNKAPGTEIGVILFNVNINFAQRETCKNVIHNIHYHKFFKLCSSRQQSKESMEITSNYNNTNV